MNLKPIKYQKALYLEKQILKYLLKITNNDPTTKIVTWYEEDYKDYLHVHYSCNNGNTKLWKLIHLDDLLLNFEEEEQEELQDQLIEEYYKK